MSLLTIVQSAANRTNFFDTVPQSVIGNNNKTVTTSLEILRELGDELAEEFNWQYLTFEQTFLTVASQQGYAISTIVTNGDFDEIIEDSFFDRTNQNPITVIDVGTFNQLLSSTETAQATRRFVTLIGDAIQIFPTPTSADTLAFFYSSDQWVESSGGTAQDDFLADTDVTRHSEQLLTLGLINRLEEYFKVPSAISFERYDSSLTRNKSKSIIAQTLKPASRRLRSDIPQITAAP